MAEEDGGVMRSDEGDALVLGGPSLVRATAASSATTAGCQGTSPRGAVLHDDDGSGRHHHLPRADRRMTLVKAQMLVSRDQQPFIQMLNVGMDVSVIHAGTVLTHASALKIACHGCASSGCRVGGDLHP
ncbi:unnamed protein product [Lampetra fluviatilis]